MSRQFSYKTGETTQEHIDNAKLKSSATTQLVSRIAFSDGRTLSYEYDAEERITKVVDSIDGTTEYTYDALGQLLTETVNGQVVNTMTYDNYGNILTKNGVVYTYGDAAWKDLLTKVGDQVITYDAQGNPTSYLGHTLTWEKGRQLKTFDNNTYTYNANGIRTSKTVGGIKHTYTLDGTKILRETWNGNELVPMYDNEESICGIFYNGTPYYFQKNLQGDIIGITDQNGAVKARYSYDAWGVCTIAQDHSEIGIATINPYRYRGYYFDAEIDMYYLQSRLYNANVARFINGDHIVFTIMGEAAAAKNMFAYCSNSPIVYIDKNGYYTASSLKKKSWLFSLASNFGINIGFISRTIRKQFFKINLWLVKLIFSVSVGLTRNYKAGISFNFTKKSIGVSTNLGMGAGYSLAFAYALSWTNVTRSMSLVYSAKNDGVYVSLDVDFEINHIVTLAVAAACVYWPALSPVLYKLLTKSKTAAVAAMLMLAPIVRRVYA